MKKFTALLKDWWAQHGKLVYGVVLLAFVYLYARHQAKESTLEGMRAGIQMQKELQAEREPSRSD